MRLRRNAKRDLRDLIEVLTATIEMHTGQRDFYRRSAEASTQETIKAVLLAVADELDRSRAQLESGREELIMALTALEAEARRAR